MRLFLSTLILMVSFAGQASDFDIKTVLKAQSDAGSKQFMAIVQGSEFYTEEFLVIFGRKAGTLKTRVFEGDYSIYIHPDIEERFKDDFYTVTIKGIEEDVSLKAKFKAKKARYNTELVYKVTEKAADLKLAEKALNKALKKFEKLDKVTDPSSLKEFKALLNLRAQQSVGGEDAGRFFESLWLQLDAAFSSTGPNRKLAKAKLKANKSDAISKKFLESDDGKWYSDRWDAAGAVEEAVMDPEYDYDDEVRRSYISTKVEFMDNKALERGAKKFVRFEVGRISGFDCEDSFAEEADITWILVDGSTFSYHPMIECD